jgi:hypothetical protein
MEERHPDLGDLSAQEMLQHTLTKMEHEKREREHAEKYPEHVKLRAVVEESQKLGAFLDWLINEKNWAICHLHQYRNASEYLPVEKPDGGFANTQDFLAEYFEIDQEKISDEKDRMVEELHEEAEEKNK